MGLHRYAILAVDTTEGDLLVLRPDGRKSDQLRETCINSDTQSFAEGAAVVETGKTRVLCTVTVEEGVPKFLRGTGRGWITAEYGMLPRSTMTRTPRESRSGGPRGRTQEIQRLIGRSLRATVDLEKLGENTFTVDCDVLQADGGTRTASITGAYVALYQALANLCSQMGLTEMPFKGVVAATSVGLLGGQALLDLDYEEDFRADSDFNVVMTDRGEFIEVQGTAEESSFSRKELDDVLALAENGIRQLFKLQQEAINLL